MAALAVILLSGSCLAVLGAAAYRVRAAAAACGARERACERRERDGLDRMRALLAAARTSSAAVLAVLDATLRDPRNGIDAVLFFTPAGAELACAFGAGERAEHFAQLRLHRDDARRLPVKAANSGCRAVAPYDGDALLPTDRAALAVPMLDERGLRGVVYASCARAAGLDTDAVVRAVELAAAPYAIALEREADRTEATYDGLTGVLGARAFRLRLHDEVRGIAAGDGVLSLWFVDTDRFKSVNDEYGHPAGDAVLQAMAALLQAHLVSGVDVAARNGGDEFCALLRAPKSLAVDRARAFCAAVRAHDFAIPIRITASVGVATLPHDAASSNALLEAADAAMYHSKRTGRDRVSFATAPGRFVSSFDG